MKQMIFSLGSSNNVIFYFKIKMIEKMTHTGTQDETKCTKSRNTQQMSHLKNRTFCCKPLKLQMNANPVIIRNRSEVPKNTHKPPVLFVF